MRSTRGAGGAVSTSGVCLRVADKGSNPSFGIALIIVTALTISLQDLVFKLFAGDLTLWQIFTLRGVIAVPVLLVIGAAQGRCKAVLRAAIAVWPVIRGLCLTATFLTFYAAIPFLSLSTVGAANYIAPIFVALLSAFVIGEAVGRAGWIGVCLGFAGVLVLLQPGTDAFSAFALLPVLGAMFYATGHIVTRTKCQGVPVAALALSLNTVMLLAGALISLILVVAPLPAALTDGYAYIFGPWSTVEATDWLVLALLAGFTISVGMMLAGAYQVAPPATIATFEYSYLVFVAIWDILFFGVSPTPVSLTGMCMIVVAGVLVMRRRV
ncbi:MAG: DMT family transporter [Pseudomonadota bacterium]